MTYVSFDYRYQGASGECAGTSFKQALDHAKNDFLKRRGYPITHPKFKIMKAELRDAPFLLSLSPLAARRYKELYLAFREGQLRGDEIKTLDDFQAIIKSKEEFNERHRIGTHRPTAPAVAR